jgi:hypothetical protein
MRDTNRPRSALAEREQSSEDLRVVYYEDRMVGAASLAECSRAECWVTDLDGYNTSRLCPQTSGITVVTPPVCSAAPGKSLCCCFRIWEHPFITDKNRTDRPPIMSVKTETCGHMELDLTVMKPRSREEYGTDYGEEEVPEGEAIVPEAMLPNGPQFEFDARNPGPHRYTYVSDFRVGTKKIGWDVLPDWERSEFNCRCTADPGCVAAGVGPAAILLLLCVQVG